MCSYTSVKRLEEVWGQGQAQQGRSHQVVSKKNACLHFYINTRSVLFYLNGFLTCAFQFVKHADARSKCLEHVGNLHGRIIEHCPFSLYSYAFSYFL